MKNKLIIEGSFLGIGFSLLLIICRNMIKSLIEQVSLFLRRIGRNPSNVLYSYLLALCRQARQILTLFTVSSNQLSSDSPEEYSLVGVD